MRKAGGVPEPVRWRNNGNSLEVPSPVNGR